MAKHVELVVTSDGSDQSWNICAWNHETGAVLKTFKGGSSAPHTMALINNEYLISAQINKPLLNYWALNTKEQAHQKMVCPGRINSLSISCDGFYCVAGIDEKIHIWQTCTGNLLAIVSKHYQPISCLKFTDDGAHFVSGSEDTTVLAWSLSEILTNSSNAAPFHKWTQHSGPVTDIHVGYGGISSRVVSVSVDQTCKMYDLLSGAMLLSIVFDVGLSSVTVDAAETRLFLGATDGKIFQINLFEPPRTLETQVQEEHESIFEGHTKKVTSLSVSMDGSMLISGCHDNTAKVWHVRSRHCLVTLQHKGPVTNAFFTTFIDSFLSNSSRKSSSTVLRPFQRRLVTETDDDGSVFISVPSRCLPTYSSSSNKYGDQKESHCEREITWKWAFLSLCEANFRLYEQIIADQLHQ